MVELLDTSKFNNTIFSFFYMKSIYLILMVSGLVFGILTITGAMPFFNLNSVICTAFVIPGALTVTDFDIFLHYENCGR